MTMWNVGNGNCVRTFDVFDTSFAKAVAITMDGEKAVFIQARSTVCLLNLSTGKRQFEDYYDTKIVMISLLPPDEDFVLIATDSGNIELRDMRDWLVAR